MKQIQSKSGFYFVLFILVTLFAYGCKKNDIAVVGIPSTVVETTTNAHSGLGDSTGLPKGTPFVLPAGVVYTDAVRKVSSNSSCSTDSLRNFGTGGLVTLIVELHNNNANATTVTFPAGLIFVCDDSTNQNGILPQRFTTSIPANSNWCVTLHLLCTNLHRHVPPLNMVYSRPVISNNINIKELTQILSAKTPFYKTTWGASKATQFQSIVWNITDHGGMTQANRDYLNSLP